MEMLFSILPWKANQTGGGGRGEGWENLCLFVIIKICCFFVVRKMEMAFKVIKVERIEAWRLCNYSSGVGLMGGGSGCAPMVKLTRRPAPCWKDHMWLRNIKQTELKLSPLWLWSQTADQLHPLNVTSLTVRCRGGGGTVTLHLLSSRNWGQTVTQSNRVLTWLLLVGIALVSAGLMGSAH